jgi:Asp-tRNA(Asn)/Glu-tRNA(Gln) amidotransferase C subunit
MTLNSSDTSRDFFHATPETNKKLQEVINKVLALLEWNQELQETFKKEFRTVFDAVTKDTEKLNKLLDAIENKMTVELASLHDRFREDATLSSEDAKKQATEIIHKYTHMEQFALANSVNLLNNEIKLA